MGYFPCTALMNYSSIDCIIVHIPVYVMKCDILNSKVMFVYVLFPSIFYVPIFVGFE